MDISSILVGICIGFLGTLFLKGKDESNARARQFEKDYQQAKSDFEVINATRRKFGRDELAQDAWFDMRRRALDNAVADALERIRQQAIHDPKRDGERWKANAPIFQPFQDRE